jgi:tetratricopeptide (TPR) repeat protein
MSNPKTEPEMCELIARSHEEAGRGNYAEAYRLIRDLPLTAGDLPGTMILRASLAMRLGQYEEALFLYDELISAVEVCMSTHLNRIECLLRLGRLAEAEKALEDGESPLQGHFGRHLMLARIAARRRNAKAVIAHLKESYRLNPRALACATSFPELATHLRTMIVNGWPAYRFDRASVCLN